MTLFWFRTKAAIAEKPAPLNSSASIPSSAM